jgi:hypothetical protein
MNKCNICKKEIDERNLVIDGIKTYHKKCYQRIPKEILILPITDLT